MEGAGLHYSDKHYFEEALRDQNTLLTDIEIRRCVGINTLDNYPGAKPQILRQSIYVRAEVKPIPLGEGDKHGGIVLVGDLSIRSWFELRGSDQMDWEYGDKMNPSTVADVIVLIDHPHQGEWYVVGVPDCGSVISRQEPVLWEANIRRIEVGARGK